MKLDVEKIHYNVHNFEEENFEDTYFKSLLVESNINKNIMNCFDGI